MRYYIQDRVQPIYLSVEGWCTSTEEAATFTLQEAEKITTKKGNFGKYIIIPVESNKVFSSSKVFQGFSTTFRQWRASSTHCSFLHGYAISFEITFTGELDSRNWVWDFGGMKRAKGSIDGMNPEQWMDYMFDHTTIIAEDDPQLESFKLLDDQKVIRLRVIPATGAERFAEYIFKKVNEFISLETEGRVRVSRVKFMENNKNSAIYGE